MAEFLELVESIEQERASVQKLFGGEGQAMRSGRRGSPDPVYVAKLAEAARLISDVQRGKRPTYLLREAMTTSDFPYLFGDIIDRQMLAAYREYPSPWRNWVRVKSVPDFRTVRRFPSPLGADSGLSAVAEGAVYPVASLAEQAPYTYAVKKYGRKVLFSWEALINDELDALKDTPDRLGRAARRTEARFATGLYVDSSGPHASLYSNTYDNIINTHAGASSSNPVLSIAALQQAMLVLSKLEYTTDGTTEPIYVEAVHLVVPPALEVTALNILNAVQLWLDTNASAGTAQQNLVTANWMRNRTRLWVDPYIPYIATSNGDTSWFLFAETGERPALEIGFLRGHEEPEIFYKAPNAQRIGGGAVNPLDGDFDTDSVEYKVRHVLGGTRMDPLTTVASNGSGS